MPNVHDLAKRREAQRRYAASLHGKAKREEYEASPHGKAKRKEYNAKRQKEDNDKQRRMGSGKQPAHVGGG